MEDRSPEHLSTDNLSMDRVSEVVAAQYDSSPEREWERAERHRTEFAVSLRAMEEYLPPPPARLLDCGGGPGRYAIELIRKGYQVTHFDLSAENLRLARQRAAEAGVTLVDFIQGDATDLSKFDGGSFDAVLLLGPLYHLLEREQRARALSEAARVLKPGGTLLAAFISRYAGHRYAAAHQPDYILERLDDLLPDGAT